MCIGSAGIKKVFEYNGNTAFAVWQNLRRNDEAMVTI